MEQRPLRRSPPQIIPLTLPKGTIFPHSPQKKHNQEKNKKNCKNKQQKLVPTFAHSTHHSKHHQKNRPFDGVFDSNVFATPLSLKITFIGIFHLHLWGFYSYIYRNFCSYIYGNFILIFIGIL
ncbi:MAG: hypothetical protein KIG90_11155 [Muribaculaceae bacterium]|nr:hypothetical protein [Muribaculaceae bacterium]